MKKRRSFEALKKLKKLTIEELVNELVYYSLSSHYNSYSQFLPGLEENYSDEIEEIRICMKKNIMRNEHMSMTAIDIFSYVITDGGKKQSQLQLLYDLMNYSVNQEKIMALTDILLYSRYIFSSHTVVDKIISRFQILQQSTES